MEEISIKTGKELIIDYLTTTFEFNPFDDEKELEVVAETVEGIRKLLNIPSEKVYEKQFWKGNYRYAYEMGDGAILKLCGPINERGIRTCSLELKGEGCREFERNNGEDKWFSFLVTLVAMYEARASRVDITIDDYDGDIISFSYLLDKLEREMYTSSFKKSYSISGNKYDGFSITFGRRMANSKTSQQLCIYEKNKEQNARGKECYQPYWTRYEMRFMHEKAAHVLEDIIYAFEGKIRYPEEERIASGTEGFKILASRLLYGMLDIKEDSTYDKSNIHKAKTDPKWLEFVQSVEKVKIPGPKHRKLTFTRYAKYFHQSSSVYFLILYMIAQGNIYQFNKEILKELHLAVNHIIESKTELKKLNTYLTEKGMTTLEENNLKEILARIEALLSDEQVPF